MFMVSQIFRVVLDADTTQTSFLQVQTEDRLEYTFFPLNHGSLRFRVKAANDAHLALTTGPTESEPMYEIFLGGWGNTKSALRRDRQKPDKAEAETPNVVTADEEREFWIRWTDGNIQVGHGGQATPFLEYSDPDPFPIGHYGVRTGWGATGEWVIEGSRHITTNDALQYQFWPVPCGAMTVDVRCPSNAHIALISSPTPANHEAHPRIEVFIGGWENSRSAIRRDGVKPDRVTAETPAILTDSTFRRFRVKWNNGTVSVLPGGSASAPILEYHDPDPVGVTHIGVRTAWGSSGNWKIKEGDEAGSAPVVSSGISGIQWVDAAGGELPPGAFAGGKDHDCELYIGQAFHNDALLPGKVQPNHKLCYVPWGGDEHPKEEFKVLCGNGLEWIAGSGTEIPPEAVPGGNAEDGETLYIGRVPHEDTITVGKVHPSHGTCYIPYGGSELGFPEYEILVSRSG
ncbi:hypothetical protein J437_LFUL004682 [Ladona fulva]|uniref:Farnesoic acid O-methyl transferase domain-containing protein n=1 Tax=Ladona fulva TaxID=123851 RepID=A0A8K0KST8_LADFU|nr:hypothetical protein J437_LFUL004682 [Ladona fulva]